MVDIVVKDWCKLVDLFCKFFLIKCHDGKQGLLQFPRFAMLKLGGLSLTYKWVFKYCAGAFRWGWVFKAKMLTLLLLGRGLGVWLVLQSNVTLLYFDDSNTTLKGVFASPSSLQSIYHYSLYSDYVPGKMGQRVIDNYTQNSKLKTLKIPLQPQ